MTKPKKCRTLEAANQKLTKASEELKRAVRRLADSEDERVMLQNALNDLARRFKKLEEDKDMLMKRDAQVSEVIQFMMNDNRRLKAELTK